jgi:U-box domain
MDIIPNEFVCPITMEIMVHPVATRYGQNFERSALVAWLDQGSDECPLTRRPLRMRDLINNYHLAQQIRQWQETQGVSLGSNSGNGADQRDDLDDKDDVLVFMYGTTHTNFQLPSVVMSKPTTDSLPVPPSTGPTQAPVRSRHDKKLAACVVSVMRNAFCSRAAPQSGRPCQ